jgi:hypothetical protein
MTLVVGVRWRELAPVSYGDDRVLELPLADVTGSQRSRN